MPVSFHGPSSPELISASKRLLAADVGSATLKIELGRKLNQPRIGSGSCAGDDPKVRVAVGTARRIRWRKLSAVEQIEKLDPEFKSCTIFPP